jgi:hypothetical protein
MAELQCQGHWSLALAALHVTRSEPGYRPDPALYATFASSTPTGDDEAGAAVDALVEAFLKEKACDGRFMDGEEDMYKLTRLPRALVAKDRDARRGGCTRRVYEAGDSPWTSTCNRVMVRVKRSRSKSTSRLRSSRSKISLPRYRPWPPIRG